MGHTLHDHPDRTHKRGLLTDFSLACQLKYVLLADCTLVNHELMQWHRISLVLNFELGLWIVPICQYLTTYIEVPHPLLPQKETCEVERPKEPGLYCLSMFGSFGRI